MVPRTLAMSDVFAEFARDTETLSVKDRRRALIYAAGRELVSRALGPGLGQWPEYLTLADLQDQMSVMMAGRAAEELVFNSVSTLGEEDLERATEMAEAIEVKFGMGASGALTLHLVPQAWDLSAAVRQHIERALKRARHVLEEKIGELEISAAETNEAKHVVH